MGIRLMVEILDHWQDAGLTAGERSDLLVIAENANDGTRETFGPVHAEYVLKRAGKTAAAWRNSIGKLMKKKVLAYATRGGRELSGFPGQHAVYQLVVLCPAAPHDGLHGQCTRTKRVTSQVTQSGAADEETGHLTGDAIPGTGHLSDAERVTSQVTPSPPSPSPPTSSEPSDPPATPATKGGGGGSQQQEAETFLAELPAPWTAGRRTARQLAPLLLEVTAEQGWRLDQELVTKLTANPGGVGNYNSVLRARIEDLPRRSTHKTRDSPRSAVRPLPPWCGDLDCDEETRLRHGTVNGFPYSGPCHCHPDHQEDTAA